MIRDGKVVHEIELPVPPAEVFSMFLDPSRLVRWIGLSADLDPDLAWTRAAWAHMQPDPRALAMVAGKSRKQCDDRHSS